MLLGLYFCCILRVMGSFKQALHHALRVAFAMLSTLLQTVSNHRSEMSRGLKAKNLYKTYHFIREGDLKKTFQQYNASYIREGVLNKKFMKRIFTRLHNLHSLCLQRITLRILDIFAMGSNTPFFFR